MSKTGIQLGLGAFAMLIATTIAPAFAEEPVAAPATTAPAAPPTELVKTDTNVGSGTEATPGTSVTVHYTGWLYSNDSADHKGKQFDSSRKPGGRPFTFPLGAGRVIQGWEQGVAGMKIGGKRTLIVPASMGYGARGAGRGLIPPNATLIFDVELLGVR